MALQLAPDSGAVPGLEDLLHRVLDASGGKAGLITTWDPDVPGTVRTALAGLDAETAAPLVALLESSAPVLAEGGAEALSGKALEEAARQVAERLQQGTLHAVALPVRAHDRFVGLICLLYSSDTPSLLKEAPGIYNLIIDHVEVVVESARLLHRLLQERRWLEAVVHHQSDGVVILDRDGLIIGFNATVETMTGWSLPQAVGRPAVEVFPLKRSEGVNEAAVALALKGGALYSAHTTPTEAQLRTRDGRWLDVEVTSAALQDEKSRPLGWVMTLRDIGGRKEIERLQRIFLSALSHELQTPIAIIKGYSGLMSDETIPLTVEQARSKASVIHEESERLERMVKQMLDATRIQAGGIRLQLEPVDVAGLLKRTVQKMETLAQSRQRRLVLKPPPKLPLVLGDTDRLQQVLTNLVENALKYSGGGSIEVAAQVWDDNVEISVQDEGPGVSDADRQRIFGLFERGAQGPGSSVRGAGLGLFICKSIVEAHGGTIGVEARPGRSGSRFYFTLPTLPTGDDNH